jgi:hypothetical protein
MSHSPPNAGRRLAAAMVVIAAALAAVGTALVLVQVLDPARPVRDLALRDARAAAQTDYGQVWRDYSACYQRLHPVAAFVAEQEQTAGIPRYPAPADTSYSVIAVRTEGPYRRVEVRVQASGLPQLDYEIDERMYGGRWVLVDRGALGHQISDDCQRGGGS